MGRPRKYFIRDGVYFVTTAVESTIAFPPNPLINTMLLSCLSRAQELHPVNICEFLFSTTHAHFIFVAVNPDDISGFMCRFKTESSHALNRLLGYKKRTIWCDGYDSPMLYLDIERAVEKIAYIYSNPAKDNLIESIDEYPGLSSWNCPDEIPCSYIPRSRYKKLNSQSPSNLREYTAKLTKKARKSSLILKHNAWMKSLGVIDPEAIRAKIVQRVYQMESEAREIRKLKGAPVIGSAKLIATPICAPHSPTRTGRRMYVICGLVEKRKLFMTHLKNQIGRAKEVYRRWKLGDFSLKFPPGLYPPCMPKLVQPLGIEAALAASW